MRSVRKITPWHLWILDRLPRWLYRLILRFEHAIEDQVEKFSLTIPNGTCVLDAGAGECQYAEQFSHCRYIAVDLAVGEIHWDYSCLDAQADLANLPFPDNSFGAAINIVVLEHISDPQAALKELARVLRPGAPLFMVVPQEWGVHQDPYDYFRYTKFGLKWILEHAGFNDFSIESVGGFFTLLGRRLLDSILYFQRGWRWLLLPLVAPVAGLLGLLLPLLDFLDRDKKTTLGYTCVAKKTVV